MTPDTTTTTRTDSTTRQSDTPNTRSDPTDTRSDPTDTRSDPTDYNIDAPGRQTTPTATDAPTSPDTTVERLVPMAPSERGPRPDPTTLPASRHD